MPEVDLSDDGFVVDAAIVGRAFGVPPDAVQAMLRTGKITSRCETGVGDDLGRWRITFYHAGRALRLTVDATGTILSRSTFPAAKRSGGGPATM